MLYIIFYSTSRKKFDKISHYNFISQFKNIECVFFKANFRYLLSKFCVGNLDIKDELVMPTINLFGYLKVEKEKKILSNRI
jgi:hypothetical protein